MVEFAQTLWSSNKNSVCRPLYECILVCACVCERICYFVSLAVAEKEPCKSCFVSCKNIITIGDVVDDHGMVISFPNAVARFGIGLHYRSLWHLIQNMLLPKVLGLVGYGSPFDADYSQTCVI